MKYFLLLTTIFLFPAFLFAQGDAGLYLKEWKQADSLLQHGFPESAAKIARSVYDRARQKGQQVQMMKGQLFLMSADFQRNEEAYKEAIREAEQHAVETSFPASAIWQSIAAQLYWNYYQQNRWKLLDRTRINTGTTIADFEQWDAHRFFEKASSLYLASIFRPEELEQIRIEQYDPILIKGEHTRDLRPALFDLLAFRALEYFENDEKDITKPAFAFNISDARAFAPASEFIKTDFKTADTASLQWLALRLYQKILAIHINDASKDAFLDADLHRLLFAYNKSVAPDKKELYKKALESIEQQYGTHPLSALASVRIAQIMMGTGRTRTDYDQPVAESEERKSNFPEIREKLEKTIARFPESEGGIIAKQMLQQVLARDLGIVTEEVALPGEASKALVRYRNVPKVWIRLVRLNNAGNKWIGSYYGYTEKVNNELLNMPILRKWSIDLPATQDYEQHSTEVKIDALPAGAYALIISSKEDFPTEDNILSYAVFQVSQISAVQSSGQGFVLDRKTGSPLKDANVDLFRQRYNDNIKGYDLVRSATVTTGNEGQFLYKNDNEHYNAIRIRYNKDTVMLTGYFPGHEDHLENKTETQTFLFTDRAIYRPGQTIFFKGIMVRKENGGMKTAVIANEEAEVIFYDVNGQKIDSRKFTSNEFGSFTGSFVAPEGLLNGNMRIATNSGSADFSVEEYKRPKFAVSFDTLKKAYALNETVRIQGRAMAYAGNTIGDASVKYRVVRNTRYPYWWYAWRLGFPQSPQMEITSGTTLTDKNGNFAIDFKTIPDPSVDPQSMPVFTYTVNADITDISGETRSGSTRINAGYTSLQLSVNIPEQANPEDLDTMNILSLNLNDQFVATDIQLRISMLKAPEQVLRKRLWPVPDQFVMDSVSFKEYFPNDAYRDEDNHLKWAVASTVAELNIRTTKDGMINIPSGTWNLNGWYLVEVSAMDKNGKKLAEKKYVRVWSSQNEGETGEALIVMPSSKSVQPGTEVSIQAVSDYKHLHLIRQVQDMDHKTSFDQVNFTGDPVIWTKQITETDRGGVLVNYITVKENRIYSQQAFINVPWSNKDLSISWETHRNKLEPGAKETWTMVVRGNKKEKVAAEMMATLYDASLDAFRPHQWNIHSLFPSLNTYSNWTGLGFGPSEGRLISHLKQEPLPHFQKVYDRIYLRFDEYQYRRFDEMSSVKVPGAAYSLQKSTIAESASVGDANNRQSEKGMNTAVPAPESPHAGKPEESTIQPRTNLRETAFFLPQLKTDDEGNVRIEFAMPEALTEWKLMTFTHTRDMSYGMLEGKVKTQKDLMVMPNLPRFLRQGDEITVSTKISNMSDKALDGTAILELFNASTMQPVNLPFRLEQKEVNFSIPEGQSISASWRLHVPESMYEPVTVRILARSGKFTDGEENILPVITNRMLVTETLPLWINGSGDKTFSFDKLAHSDTSKTLVQHALTLEYTGNPAWYAVQSLPYLMEYPYECVEQTFNRYYATALAAHIVARSPRIKAIFDKWKAESMFSSFSSPLERNEELRSALLQETPWVLQAKTEAEQRKRLGELFDTYKLSKESEATARMLKDMQLPDGSFPWFKGMLSDRFITQYIITGLGRLQQLGIKDNKDHIKNIVAKALPYLDRKITDHYNLLVKNKAKMSEQQISNTEIQYLYMRSFFNQEIEPSVRTAFNYYQGQASMYWARFNPYMKGMIAIALNRSKDHQIPKAIIQSLKETAIRKEEMGMYWMQRGYSYWWYEAPVEAQALLIECFEEVANDSTSVNAMKIWLLKNKQTQSWETTKATADACYALLLSGSDWLSHEPEVTIQLGKEQISNRSAGHEAGTGYFKVRYEGKDVTPKMSDIKISVADNSNNTSWGAVYWQYFEDLDKISYAATPLTVRKQLFKEHNTDRGPELQPISSNNVLKVGDKLKVRIEITTDRDMEYVHLKDMRASCFEPLNVISAYRWQGGLGYYETTKDASTSFFFDHLNKGKYVFEYPVFVHQAGTFSNGIATIQCMYAPEFSGHTEGVRIKVE